MDLNRLLLIEEQIIKNSNSETLQQVFTFLKDKKTIKSEIKTFSSFSQVNATRIMRIFNFLFHNNPNQMTLIIDIYEKFTAQYTKSKKTVCNDFALMLYNMVAYKEMSENQITNAKKTLKKCRRYAEGQVPCNPLVLSICLGNLATIYLSLQKYQDSFIESYKALKILEPYIDKLKVNESKKLNEDIVVLVNIYYLLRQSLSGYIDRQSFDSRTQKQYLQQLHNFHSRGLKISTKYLGKDSKFTKLFNQTPVRLLTGKSNKRFKKLPIVMKSQQSSQSQSNHQLFRNLLEAIENRVNPKLDEIHNLILNNNQNPQILNVQPKQIQSPRLPVKQLQIKPDLSHQILLLQVNYTSDLEINIKLFKGKKTKFGSTLISISKNGLKITEQLIQERVISILINQINVNDAKPFDIDILNCSPLQFIKYYLIPFINLDQNKVSIWPKSVGVFPQKKINFLDQECLIFANYITDNIFRISISPTGQYSSLYLTIEFKQQLMIQVVKDYENAIKDPDIMNILKLINNEKLEEIEENLIKLSSVKINNLEILEKELDQQISAFQKFLIKHKFVNTKRAVIFGNNNYYFKCVIDKFTQKACFYALKNLDKEQSLQIICQNTFETFGVSGKIFAKGYCRYDHYTMLQDFGINYKKLDRLSDKFDLYDCILKKYYLQIFQKQLVQQQKQFYGENAMKQYPLIIKGFKRNYLLKEYQIPITASIICINGDEPLGIKVSGFDVNSSIQKGVFLKMNKRKWIKHKQEGNKPFVLPTKQNILVKKVLNKFKPKEEAAVITNYQICPALNKEGYNILLENLNYDPNSKNHFFMKEESGQQFRWGRLEKILTYNNFKRRLIPG